MIIRTNNNLGAISPRTYLSQDHASGATTMVVRNSIAMGTGWAAQVGETGEELTEILVGTPTSTINITSPAMTFSHPQDTPVYFIKYDQIVFERSTAGTLGTALPMSNGTIVIQANDLYTQFDDTSGLTTYAYRTYFRNSALAVNSTESDWITSAGFDFYSLNALRERVKEKLWNSQYLTTSMMTNWVNEWKDEMSNAVISLNADYALGTVNVPFGTTGLGTITTADFKDVRRVWTTYNGIDTFQSTKMDVNDFDPNQIFTSTHPYHYFQGDTIIGVKPSDTTGTISLVFSRFGTTMVNDTDVLPQPFRSYTKSFIDYIEAQALRKDNKPDWKDKLTEAQISKQQFIAEMSPRDQSGPTYIQIVEPIDGGDNNY